MRIVTIAGTRPEAIKLAPLVLRLRERRDVDHRLIATGQHRDLFAEALLPFDLAADIDLGLGGGDALPDRLADCLPPLLDRLSPDLVLVQGDTSSAWAAARAAAARRIPVGHVEAGLRSGDPALPFPEERNRREIDAVATLLFAPSRHAAANLRRERLHGRVVVTGNTGIDALLHVRAQAPLTLHDSARRLVLVTCHRREAGGMPVQALCAALLRLAERGDVDIVLPVHPRPEIAEPVRGILADRPGIHLLPPLPYPELVRLMDAAHLLLTDSGGLQEEAPALALPTLVLRPNSERPEVLACGACRLVGLDPDRIVAETARLLDDPVAHAAMARPAFPYGRGNAAPRILAAIDRWWRARAGSLAFRPADPHWEAKGVTE